MFTGDWHNLLELILIAQLEVFILTVIAHRAQTNRFSTVFNCFSFSSPRYLFCICSLSQSLYLWSHLCVLWLYTLCVYLLPLLAADSFCSSFFAPTISSISVFFYICLLFLLVADSFYSSFFASHPHPISSTSVFFYICLLSLLVADSLFQLILLYICRGEHFHLQPPSHPKTGHKHTCRQLVLRRKVWYHREARHDDDDEGWISDTHANISQLPKGHTHVCVCI